VVELEADAVRIHAIPFGANLDTLPETMPGKPPLSPLDLLWVGSGWTRKGGDIVLAAFEALRASGVTARLTLVGDVPEGIVLPPGAERAGFLDKNRPRHAARLADLYARSHLFILPTRADCTPMVLAEANAHGTPVLVTETGGIGSLVEEGRSGQMLPMTAGPEDWAAAIRDMTYDPEAHAALCRSSFDHARTRLSWDAWARDVIALLRERVA
jgi:glycosyltransferase involved in cell wall biosynthesis